MPGHSSAPVGPVDGRKVPRFAGSGSFARLPEIDRVPDYDVAVLGVPFDNGTSYRPGARFGPMAVRQASRHLRPGHHVELDTSPFTTIQVVDAGNYDQSTCQPVTAHWLKIFPPGQFTALYVKFSAQTCSAKLPSNLGTPLSVDAVKAGKGKAGGGL